MIPSNKKPYSGTGRHTANRLQTGGTVMSHYETLARDMRGGRTHMKIVADSHVDHGLTTEQLDFITDLFSGRDAFFIEEIELPENLGAVPCGLYGPIMGDGDIDGDDVFFATRGAREYKSRLVRRPTRPTRTVTVIAGPYNEEPCVLYTAFGGQQAPKEPNDPTLESKDKLKSLEFWAVHALSEDEG